MIRSFIIYYLVEMINQHDQRQVEKKSIYFGSWLQKNESITARRNDRKELGKGAETGS